MENHDGGVLAEQPPRSYGATAMDEAQFRSIADSLPAQIAILSPSGELESVNQSVLDYFGLTLTELRGWSNNESLHPDDRASVVAAWRRAVDEELPYDIQHRMRRADGVYRWFHVRGQPLRNSDGRLARWCVMCTDIDEHKRAELFSAGEKRLLEMIAVGVPLLVILDELCKLLDSVAEGCTSGVLVLDRTNTRIQHAAAPGLPSSYNRALEGLPVSIEQGPCGMAATLQRQVIVRDTETETRWDTGGWPALARAHGLRSCWSSPVLSVSGESLGTFAIYQRVPADPSPAHQSLMQQFAHIVSVALQRMRHEEALQRNEALLAGAEVLSATGCFSLELSSDRQWWSAQTYRILGVEPTRDPTFPAIRERIYVDDLPAFEQAMNAARRGEEFTVELRLQMTDGTLRYIQVVVARGKVAPNGEVLEILGALRDITDRRLSEEALGKARSELAHVARVASLGVLTAAIAHEVNQPLTGIIANASTCLLMLAADPPNVAGACETARRTIRDSNRAFAVIAKLRTLFAKNDVTTEAVDLNDVAQEVLALLRSELQRNRVVLRTQLAPELPAVRGDRVQLQQVILNLVLNASDAMVNVEARSKLLTLVTELDGATRVRLTVCDSGIGLDVQSIPRLFEAFYTTKSSGMGIGLSVSRSIIESHHGAIWATPNDGPGASFSFSIPVLSADPDGPIVTGPTPRST